MLALYWGKVPEEERRSALSLYREERLKSISHAERCRESEAAELLLIAAMQDMGFGPSLPLDIHTMSRGKPFIPGGPEFSLSHSGGKLLCALSDRPVGADIQELRRFSPAVARRYMSAQELSWLEAQPDKDRAFTALWSMKESYVKRSGLGLAAQGMRSFSVLPGGTELWNEWIGETVVSLCSCYGAPEHFKELTI